MSLEISSVAGRRRGGGFTLVEIMVSIAILSIIILVISNLIALVTKSYLQTTVKVGQFRSAQAGFESLTRRLGQATLNTYLDYEDASNLTDSAYSGSSTATTFVPTHYGRQSELRFIGGNIAPAAATAFGGTFDTSFRPSSPYSTSSPFRPTHAIFFAAPLSTTSTAANIGLNRLLNICGYYVEYNNDPGFPTIMGTASRYRFRLMEMVQSSENVSLYADVAKATPPYQGHGWFEGPIPPNSGDSDSGTTLNSTACSNVLAENVVALIILPRLSADDELQYESGTYSLTAAQAAAVLSPNYFYDSTIIGSASGAYADSSTFNFQSALNSKNQLPPIVQVTMVAIDEPSAIRLQNIAGASANPTTTVANIYKDGGGNLLFSNSANFATDLATFQTNLGTLHLTYRIFQSNVSIKEAKWSSLQTGN